jgi:hypothetical protein
MGLDQNTLQIAADDMFSALGPLDDLGAELSNTVANVYYQFHLMSQNMGDPGSALGVRRDRDFPSDFRNVLGTLGYALAAYQAMEGMIRSLREARTQNAAIGDYLVRHMLDTFKYRIPNADKKTPIRRAIERQFRTVDEIAGLYKQMREFMHPP